MKKTNSKSVSQILLECFNSKIISNQYEVFNIIDGWELKDLKLVLKDCGYSHKYNKDILQSMVKDLYLFYICHREINNPFLPSISSKELKEASIIYK